LRTCVHARVATACKLLQLVCSFTPHFVITASPTPHLNALSIIKVIIFFLLTLPLRSFSFLLLGAMPPKRAPTPWEGIIATRTGSSKTHPPSTTSQHFASPAKKSKVDAKSSRSPQKPSKLLPMPTDFATLHSLVTELRSDRTAPVDSNGAEELCQIVPDDPTVFRYHALVALMLSSQTKDQQVGDAMRRLQAHPSGGLTIQSISAMTEETLKTLIYGVGFHNNKTIYIKKTTAILVNKYNSDIPPTADEMINDLPGVGPKMAFLIDQIAWKRPPVGIGVDTHMHRIFNVIKWVESKNPEDTRLQVRGERGKKEARKVPEGEKVLASCESPGKLRKLCSANTSFRSPAARALAATVVLGVDQPALGRLRARDAAAAGKELEESAGVQPPEGGSAVDEASGARRYEGGGEGWAS